MTEKELRVYFQKLADKIMRYALTAEQAAAVRAYLRKTYPISTPAGKIRDQVMIDTGVGESLFMIAQFSQGKQASDEFAKRFCTL